MGALPSRASRGSLLHPLDAPVVSPMYPVQSVTYVPGLYREGAGGGQKVDKFSGRPLDNHPTSLYTATTRRTSTQKENQPGGTVQAACRPARRHKDTATTPTRPRPAFCQ